MPDHYNLEWPEQADRDRVLGRFLGLGERFSVKSYYPQLQSRVKELEETLTELIKTKAALTRMNESLEEKVRERTQALEESVHRLKETQEALIVSEKLATHGLVSARIAHDLNSPLGAISSSTGSFDNLINDFFAHLKPLMAKCPRRSIQLIFERLPRTAARGGQEPSRVDRSRLKALSQTIERQGIPDSAWVAELALDLDLETQIQDILDELGPDETHALLEVLGDILGFYRTRKILSLGVLKASEAIKKLRDLDLNADQGSMEPFTDRVDLDACIQAAASTFNRLLHPKLMIVLPSASGLVVRSQEEALSKALVMLLENAFQAVKYSGRVEIALAAHDRAVDILIKDDGCGIAADIIDHIWEPFFTTKAPGEGTGFGLVIVRRTIERSGGSIRVQSAPGGTCFTIELPRYGEGAAR